ncbi:MAG TPA: hypothetical protein VGN73_08835 [Gemmatimonadaceae bacterium]|jgi:hypothetical protein|nr:hypothetical protein [Gemmatimonadaceae bacterium]
MRFFRRLGCLIIIIAICVAVWYWYARVPTTKSSSTTVETATSSNSGWQPLTAADADRGRAAVQSLGNQSGPVFANLSAAEAASYIFTVLAKQLPPSAQNAQAAIIGDRLYVRADVELKDFGGSKALGPLGMLLGDRDSVRLGGTINMLKPGLGEFLVQEVKLGKLDVPNGLIPRILTQMKRDKPVEGISQNGLPMVMPSYISDVRIANGKITLYKSVR